MMRVGLKKIWQRYTAVRIPLIAVLSTVIICYGAVNYFAVDPAELREFLIASVLLVVVLIIAALFMGGLFALLRYWRSKK